MFNNFMPHPLKTVNGVVGAASTDITLGEQAVGTNAIRLTNSGTQLVFWKFGTGGASVTTCTPMLPNTTEIYDCPYTATILAVIAPATGSTLFVTPGIGS